MAMSQDEFRALVHRLESEYRLKPRGYKLHVMLLGALGYAYVLAFFVLLALLTGALVLLAAQGDSSSAGTYKLVLPVMLLILVLLRAMWISMETPRGIELRSRQNARLFQTLEKIRYALNGPRIHSVLLTDDFNATISRVPRIGLFGWQKNQLVIGLPLMHALSAKEFAAILAREYSHLSGAHGRFNAWIYRVRNTCSKLLESLELNDRWGGNIFRGFFQWYAPYFNAYSFVQVRINEYQADRIAAEIAGAHYIACALIKIRIKGDYLNKRFWPHVCSQADHTAVPRFSPYSDMAVLMRKDISESEARHSLDNAMREKANCDDTHPSLRDRLASLGEDAILPRETVNSAASHFLENNLGELTDRLDEQWRMEVADTWNERFEYMRSATARLRELDILGTSSTLSTDDLFERAWLTEELHNTVRAIPMYQGVLDRRSAHAAANYHLGRLLLAEKDGDGLNHIDIAMRNDPEYVLEGCKLAYKFLLDSGDIAAANTYHEHYYRQLKNETCIRERPESINIKDILLPPEPAPLTRCIHCNNAL
ncbi:MAG: hypothetical protein BMS9Abin26_0023 [Gammaproteobacteria bacterium]|nr:MAG: hypothetical protein BMS9Abin26_0023 [Gammaproteobacteria bacterium]